MFIFLKIAPKVLSYKLETELKDQKTKTKKKARTNQQKSSKMGCGATKEVQQPLKREDPPSPKQKEKSSQPQTKRDEKDQLISEEDVTSAFPTQFLLLDRKIDSGGPRPLIFFSNPKSFNWRRAPSKAPNRGSRRPRRSKPRP